MTRQEHIERLKAIRNYCCAKRDIESLDFAIESLEADEAYQLEYERTRDCKTCSHAKDNHCARTEECHECMWNNKYESEAEDLTFKDDNAVSRLSVKDILYANAYELEYPDSSSEYVVNRDEIIKYLMELPSVYPKSDASYCKLERIQKLLKMEGISDRDKIYLIQHDILGE